MMIAMSSAAASIFLHRRVSTNVRAASSFVATYNMGRHEDQQQRSLIATTLSTNNSALIVRLVVSQQPYPHSFSTGITFMRNSDTDNGGRDDGDGDATATMNYIISTAQNVAKPIRMRGTSGTNSPSSLMSSSSMMGPLLEAATNRAFRTLSSSQRSSLSSSGYNDDEDYKQREPGGEVTTTLVTKTSKSITENLIDATILRSMSVVSNNDNTNNNDIINDNNMVEETKQHEDKRTYLNNPSVTLTAMAHILWRSTIHPYNDIVIDATCGNGKDLLALTDMLFPPQQQQRPPPPPTINDDKKDNGCGRLIGIDIQECAIRNTYGSLLSSTTFSYDTYRDRITLLVQSHEKLIEIVQNDNEQQSRIGRVGLVCYNLGFLPGANRERLTQTQTTLHSITDAALLLRIGGLLSVMTYPASNKEESIVVEHFMEGLGMLTTRTEGGWRKYVNDIPKYDDDENGRVRLMVKQALERVVTKSGGGGGGGDDTTAWRVFVHKPLGRPTSPVLVTATRIK